MKTITLEEAGRILEETFAKGVLCADCPFYSEWMEHHGPGLHEPMAACAAEERGDPRDCPGVEAAQQEEGSEDE